jgi:hypothetical protein
MKYTQFKSIHTHSCDTFLNYKSSLTGKFNLFFILTGFFFFSQSAFSDATITYEQVGGVQKTSNTMQIRAGKIRFTPPNQNNNYSLYDSNTGELTHVDSNRKVYLKMDENSIAEQANKAKQQMDMMRQQMIVRMKDMPPEQKKQVEQMMSNHMAQVDAKNSPPEVNQKKTSRTENIAGIQCTVYESFINGVKNSELCMIAPETMGLSSEDSKALMSMQDFMKRMQRVAQNMMGGNTPSTDIRGIPLHTILFAPNGTVQLETRLVSISTLNIDKDRISVPAGYAPVAMPDIPVR